jgi:hypothetical protein
MAKLTVYRIITAFCGLIVGITTFWLYTEHQIRIKAEQSHNQSLTYLVHFREVYHIDSLNTSFRGQYLKDLLNVPEPFFTAVSQQHNLRHPYLVLVVKEIDCASCYNQETESIQKLLQQHIPVMVIAFQEADFIYRDFKQRIILFPPPFTQTFLRNLSAKMALLWVSPEGLILDAEIPSIRFPERSKKFYERISLFHNYVSRTN